MTDRLPLPAELFRTVTGPVGIDGQANGIVHQLMGLADRGDYVQAAGQAAESLRGNVNDVRLASIYLMGSFVERGASALPDVLARVDMMLGESSDPSRLVDSALAWLFRALTDQIAFHTTQRGETWNAWLRDVTPQHVEEISVRCETIFTKSPGGAGSLNKLARWAREKLGPAAARVVKPEPEPDANLVLLERPIDLPPAPTGRSWDEADDEHEPVPDEPVPDEHDEPVPDEHDEHDEHEHDDEEPESDDDDEPESGSGFRDFAREPPRPRPAPRPREAPRPRPSTDVDSPALTHLRDKLRGFEILVERGDLDKAAVIARDIQAVLDDFNPLTYLPSLFARYLKLLNGNFGELEQRWAGEDTRAWRALVQLYHADLDGFLDD